MIKIKTGTFRNNLRKNRDFESYFSQKFGLLMWKNIQLGSKNWIHQSLNQFRQSKMVSDSKIENLSSKSQNSSLSSISSFLALFSLERKYRTLLGFDWDIDPGRRKLFYQSLISCEQLKIMFSTRGTHANGITYYITPNNGIIYLQ